MNKKYKLIAFIGKSGAGKDTLAAELINNDKFNMIISCTTRPKREGEIDGVNYHFISDNLFHEYERSGQLLESTYFKGWNYGTPKYELQEDKINVGIFNPAGIHALLKIPDIELYIYWVKASDKVRLIRQLNRESSPDVKEIIRRYGTDEADFSDNNITFEYKEILNEYVTDIYKAIEEIKSQHLEV